MLQDAARTAALSLVLALCGTSSWASTKLHPNADALKAAGHRRMTITRYSGHADFHSQQSLIWELKGDHFVVGNVQNSRVQIGECETLLESQQKFPLKKMASTGYISTADVKSYLQGSRSYEPDQVNFAQASRDMSMNEAVSLFGEDEAPERVHDLLLVGQERDIVPIITASMWSVGGQVLDTKTGVVRPTDMPWQKDPLRVELAKNFDRKKYKLVWEWGRTAQDLPRETEALAHALASINYQELIAFGGDIHDAYVMFHSFDEVNTRAYSLRFPNSLYPANEPNKNDTLFLVPLAQAMAAFPPSRQSEKFAEILANSDGVLNDESAQEFLLHFMRTEFTQLDMIGKDGRVLPRPLALHNMSSSIGYQRSNLEHAFHLGNVPQVDLLARQLTHLQPMTPTWNAGQYTDLADIEFSKYYYRDNNALEISNLDLAAAQADPKYIQRVLIGVFVYHLKALAPGPFNAELVQQLVAILRRDNVKFGMTTFNPTLANRIRALSPNQEHEFEYGVPHDDFQFKGQEWLTMGFKTPPHAFLFTINHILQLINDNPDLYRESMNSCRENIWARHLMLTNPDVF